MKKNARLTVLLILLRRIAKFSMQSFLTNCLTTVAFPVKSFSDPMQKTKASLALKGSVLFNVSSNTSTTER